jgi:hypothetical protein
MICLYQQKVIWRTCWWRPIGFVMIFVPAVYADTLVSTDTFYFSMARPPRLAMAKSESLGQEYKKLCRQAGEYRVAAVGELAAGNSDSQQVVARAAGFLEQTYLVALELFDGTVWSMNGYTEQPGNGELACGHYVGLPLARLGLQFALPGAKSSKYVLGQQFPENIARALAVMGTYRAELTPAELTAYLEQGEAGLYIGGVMGSHVGVFVKDGMGSFFRHSDPGWCVRCEDVQACAWLNACPTPLVIARMDWTRLAQCWLTGRVVRVENGKSKYGK